MSGFHTNYDDDRGRCSHSFSVLQMFLAHDCRPCRLAAVYEVLEHVGWLEGHQEQKLDFPFINESCCLSVKHSGVMIDAMASTWFGSTDCMPQMFGLSTSGQM